MAGINNFSIFFETFLWKYFTVGYLPIIGALLIGIIPALIWLKFWLREDKKNPEPRRLIVLSFLAGLAAVIFSIPLQKFAKDLFPGADIFFLFIIWAAIEEAMKFFWCYFVALRNKENNEPIDALIYMVTTALGFAAFENALFVLDPLINGNIIESLITGNLRFIGASLLHVVASSTIGVFLAWSYYRSKKIKFGMAALGLIIATILHILFNFLIILGEGAHIFLTFLLVWIGIIILLALFEKIKKIKPSQT